MGERSVKFREVVRAPFWLMLFIYFLGFSLVVAIWAAMTTAIAAAALVIVTVATVFIYIRTPLVIEIDEKELRVGAAHIDRLYLGKARALTPQEMALMRTRDADPAAYLALRFWTSHGVRIDINDKRDSTPYWLITSKRKRVIEELINKV
jgi:hypothetical protein